MGATHTKPTRWGVLAEFTSAQQIYHACEQVRDAGFKKWDAYTPFPVHGLDKAAGIKPKIEASAAAHMPMMRPS